MSRFNGHRKAELARDFMLHRINPLLTEQNLRSRMFYMLSMIELRYSPQRNLFTGKKYLTKALWALRSYGFHGDTEEYLFLKVFLGNGSAFIRAREGRADRAIALAKTGTNYLPATLAKLCTVCTGLYFSTILHRFCIFSESFQNRCLLSYGDRYGSELF